ncbi:MAG: hypothetical protein LBE37_07580, partial [Sphingobacterium sp.]|nr:hypothetical protein [Sphingobacterium sp.]
MTTHFLKDGFSKSIFIALFLFVFLGACRPDKEEHMAEKLFVTTNSGSLYCFDLGNDSLCWEQLQQDPEIDELTYMAIYKDELVKDYLDGTITSY